MRDIATAYQWSSYKVAETSAVESLTESVHLHAQVLASEMRFQTLLQFFCSKVRPKSAFLQTMYLGCV